MPVVADSDDENYISDSDEDPDFDNDSDEEDMEIGDEEEILEESLVDAETEVPAKRNKVQAKNNKIQWKKGENQTFSRPSDYVAVNEKLRIKPNILLTRISSPMSFYELFVDDSFINHIHEQTKLYNEWRKLNSSTRTVKDIEKQDIKVVIGIVLQMGIVKLPNHHMYISDTRSELIAEGMTRNRFEELISVLRFNDNNTLPDKDSSLFNKCHSVQPLIDHFR